jgi:hypothetical protein
MSLQKSIVFLTNTYPKNLKIAIVYVLMSILARGHECNVWLLIACVSENYEYFGQEL